MTYRHLPQHVRDLAEAYGHNTKLSDASKYLTNIALALFPPEELTTEALDATWERIRRRFKDDQLRQQQSPVQVQDDSIVINPNLMEANRFYPAELNGKPYLYRRVTDRKLEVYTLP